MTVVDGDVVVGETKNGKARKKTTANNGSFGPHHRSSLQEGGGGGKGVEGEEFKSLRRKNNEWRRTEEDCCWWELAQQQQTSKAKQVVVRSIAWLVDVALSFTVRRLLLKCAACTHLIFITAIRRHPPAAAHPLVVVVGFQSQFSAYAGGIGR